MAIQHLSKNNNYYFLFYNYLYIMFKLSQFNQIQHPALSNYLLVCGIPALLITPDTNRHTMTGKKTTEDRG